MTEEKERMFIPANEIIEEALNAERIAGELVEKYDIDGACAIALAINRKALLYIEERTNG